MRLVSIVILGTILASSAFAQTITNGGFESGHITGHQSAFAGGTSKFLSTGQPGATANNSINGTLNVTPWTYSGTINGQADRWVNSTAAHGGDQYIFLSSTGFTANPPGGANDDCIQYTLTGLVSGQEYKLGVFAADAGSAVPDPYIRFELDTDLNGTSETLSPLSLAYILPDNAAWSSSALTTIPWVEYTYRFTYNSAGSPTPGTATLWLSANSLVSTQAASIVFDDVSIMTIPEPPAIALFAGVLLFIGIHFARLRAAGDRPCIA